MHVIRNATDADLDQVKACALAAYTRYIERIGKKAGADTGAVRAYGWSRRATGS